MNRYKYPNFDRPQTKFWEKLDGVYLVDTFDQLIEVAKHLNKSFGVDEVLPADNGKQMRLGWIFYAVANIDDGFVVEMDIKKIKLQKSHPFFRYLNSERGKNYICKQLQEMMLT